MVDFLIPWSAVFDKRAALSRLSIRRWGSRIESPCKTTFCLMLNTTKRHSDRDVGSGGGVVADYKGSYIRMVYAVRIEGPSTIYVLSSLQLKDSYFPTDIPLATQPQIDVMKRRYKPADMDKFGHSPASIGQHLTLHRQTFMVTKRIAD